MDINWRGKTQKHGAQLWFVGPDTAKDYLQARWNRPTGHGAVHFSKDLPESYFKGLTAEYRTFGYKRGRKVSWWEKKKGEPNEPLDLMNYNLAAAYFLELHKKTEHSWQSLRNRLVPQVLDLFQQTEEPPAAAPPVDDVPVASAGVQQVVVHTSAQTTTPPPAPKIVNGRISLAGLRRGNP